MRAYLDDGTLAWRDGRVSLSETGTLRLPLTLRAVLGARIDALEPDAREVLGVASVIGIRFYEGALEALLFASARDGCAVAARRPRRSSSPSIRASGASRTR